ncbi:pantoate--beta-alanine ligase [Candidatus Amarobacter glycogenicus]|uniref:pantoate--beta-alanine ligase n=1 Tax=Candidatus Amarobacter glycogenicus TaxID=3140699 RepID=UPI002A0CD50B|nr:pantoate--beta-alanine ligase [Dehalococcoidia bacterium]MCC6266293.1 pantoate--beta-alanine ligase [Dehalococcoidia bacterium]
MADQWNNLRDARFLLDEDTRPLNPVPPVILTTPAAMRRWRAANSGSVGFVPTMGYLHEGHMDLVRRSIDENLLTVVSIFVNPTQFAPDEDFSRYPRDEVRDLAQLSAAGVDAVYLPGATDMYPEGYQTYVEVEQVTRPLEGARRPGHFRGVTTVVLKLFNAVGPDRAYFGRKDAQQLRVIQRMVRDLDLGVEVVPCDIVRETDGLAMSSRNVYLSPEQRTAATVLKRALDDTRRRWAEGERDADTLRAAVSRLIDAEPLAELDYVSLADDESLQELEGTAVRPAILSMVVKFGKTRLLDNIELA